jgi:tetratricopeptide (TPR) repeat protein
LDTETTGLAGGTGTCAFLVGVGTIEDGGFRVRLFFMRDYDEEAAMLAGLAEFLRWYDVLVTYNGKAYDAPLLETRYRLSRKPFPLERMFHLDLLHGARQLWKLRMRNCRLIELESEILGVLREGDLPGELIPYYYFEYLRTRQAFRLVPLFHHNVIDIVSLACLTAVVLPAFAAPTDTRLRHAADLLGLARWLRRSQQHEGALELYRRSIDAGLPDSELFPALWESALIEKKLGRHEAKLALLSDLAEVKNPFRQSAYEELAKHYERHEKELERALAMTEAALRIEASAELVQRKTRLTRRLDRQAEKPVKRLFQQA